MPQGTLDQLIERAIGDEAFAAQLRSPAGREAALAEYDLTEDQKQAFRAGELGQLDAIGLEERVTKAMKKL